ncbi:MAG: DNRLRE domain-containing protein, partial [Actinoallomurus sp.]
DVADAFVDQTTPDTNYGTNTALRVDDSPLKRSYLRFNVSGIRGTVTKATLRIYADSSGSDLRAYRLATDGGWQENTITWNNAPALGTMIGSASPVTGGTWVDIDVTSLVQADGVHEFAVDTSGGTQIHLSSREDTGHAPQIIVESTG